jgi:hypothetical protein
MSGFTGGDDDGNVLTRRTWHDLECATGGRREDEILYIMDERVVFVKMGS